MEVLLDVPVSTLLKGPLEALEHLPTRFRAAEYFGSFKALIVEEMRATVEAGLTSTDSEHFPAQWSRSSSAGNTDRVTLRVGSRTAHHFRMGDAVLLDREGEDELSQALSRLAVDSGPAQCKHTYDGIIGVVTGCYGEGLELTVGRGMGGLNWVSECESSNGTHPGLRGLGAVERHIVCALSRLSAPTAPYAPGSIGGVLD